MPRPLWLAPLVLVAGACTSAPAADPTPTPAAEPPSSTSGIQAPPAEITAVNAIGYCRNSLLLLADKDTWSDDELEQFVTCQGDFAAGAEWAGQQWQQAGQEPSDIDRAEAAVEYAGDQSGQQFAAFVVATAYVTWFLEERPIDWNTAQPGT